MSNCQYPTTWLFELDERTTHMSVVPTGPEQRPVLATPATIRQLLSTFASSAQTPAEVSGMLELSGFLLEMSVVHYEFAALSVEKALQALELMLRHKADPASGAGMSGLIRALQSKTTLRPMLVEFRWNSSTTWFASETTGSVIPGTQRHTLSSGLPDS